MCAAVTPSKTLILQSGFLCTCQCSFKTLQEHLSSGFKVRREQHVPLAAPTQRQLLATRNEEDEKDQRDQSQR